MTVHAYETIKVEADGDVARVTLNRPGALNAMNGAMVDELIDCFSGLRDASSRVVVLSGAGESFCAGLDLKDPAFAPGAVRDVARLYAFQQRLHRLILAMRQCPQPVLALAQGAAAGGGFAMLLASDIRVATPDASFSAAFIRVGLSGCDVGVSYLLPKLVGGSLASEMLLTGRPVSGARAHQLGLLAELAAPDQLERVGDALLQRMLATSVLGLRLTKEGLNVNLDAASLDAAMALEDRNQTLCASTGDFQEALAAFAEKRRPTFRSG